MLEIQGLLTVREAAKRLNRSTEQVRRYLREGKLRGRRIGNQWFIEESSLQSRSSEKLIPPDLMKRIERMAAEIARRNPDMPDVVDLLRESREGR